MALATDPFVYGTLEESGQAYVGHLDASCKAIKGERRFVPRRFQPDPDMDPWPCASCVSLEQLAAWEARLPTARPALGHGRSRGSAAAVIVPAEESFSSGEKTLYSGAGVADTTGVGGYTPGNQEDTTMARSTSTYARKSAPIQTAVYARNGLCPTHRTPILSDGECWECGTVPATLTAPKLAALKSSFALAIADGIEGAASLRAALLTAYKAGQLTDASIDAALDMIITMREAQADTTETPGPSAMLPTTPARPATTGPAPKIATGHYAVTSATGNNDLDFYLVKNVTEGKWAGRTFVEQVVGGGTNYPVRGAAGVAVLRRIEEAGAIEAGRLYGQEIGRCYVCHRTLTDEASRAAGIGPDCASREG